MAEAKSTKTVELNLLPSDDLEGRPGGKFLMWALSWGKRIVILTEAIVILAFLSRFWLDTIVADLTEQITSQKNIVAASANFEKKFRGTAKRIEEAKTIENQGSLLDILEKASALVPKSVNITQMTLAKNEVNFQGQSDESSLATLVAAFKNSPKFTDLSVDKITKVSPSPTIAFSIKAKYVWP